MSFVVTEQLASTSSSPSYSARLSLTPPTILEQEDENVFHSALKFARPEGGFVSARAVDMAPYLGFAGEKVQELIKRLAINTLARHLLCSIMVWRRRRPTEQREASPGSRDVTRAL